MIPTFAAKKDAIANSVIAYLVDFFGYLSSERL